MHAVLTQRWLLTSRPTPAPEDRQKLAGKAQHSAPPAPDVARRSPSAWCCCCLGGGPHGHRGHGAAQRSCGQPGPGPDTGARQPRHRHQRQSGPAAGGARHRRFTGAAGVASRYRSLTIPSNCCPRSLTCQPHRILRLCDLTGRGTQFLMQSSPHAILCRPLKTQVTVSQLHMCARRLSGLTVRRCRERRPQRLTERGQRGAPGGLWRAGRCGAESAVLGSAGLLLRCWSGRGHWSRALPHCAAPILSAGDHESARSDSQRLNSKSYALASMRSERMERCTQPC